MIDRAHDLPLSRQAKVLRTSRGASMICLAWFLPPTWP